MTTRTSVADHNKRLIGLVVAATAFSVVLVSSTIAASTDCDAKPVGRDPGIERPVRISIVPGRQSLHRGGEEVVGKLDPARLASLGDCPADKPGAPVLIQVADTSSLKLTDARARRIENE